MRDPGTTETGASGNTFLPFPAVFLRQDKMAYDWVTTTISGVGILLFVNAMYCCVGISGVRSLLRRIDAIEQRLALQHVYSAVQHVPAPISGDPV